MVKERVKWRNKRSSTTFNILNRRKKEMWSKSIGWCKITIDLWNTESVNMDEQTIQHGEQIKWNYFRKKKWREKEMKEKTITCIQINVYRIMLEWMLADVSISEYGTVWWNIDKNETISEFFSFIYFSSILLDKFRFKNLKLDYGIVS